MMAFGIRKWKKTGENPTKYLFEARKSNGVEP
jgi:hypothetical protein